MEILKIVLTILFAIDCIVLTALVLLQEGKSAGLGAIAGGADTFWGQNKGRSKEGKMVLVTRISAILFLVLAIVLNLGIFA
ncbi:MAG: preprotein translocase subunit SecG [Tyzzerella sp.]|nr:preprotein translocase subunit SecG [Tyzzerella sp.]